MCEINATFNLIFKSKVKIRLRELQARGRDFSKEDLEYMFAIYAYELGCDFGNMDNPFIGLVHPYAQLMEYCFRFGIASFSSSSHRGIMQSA